MQKNIEKHFSRAAASYDRAASAQKAIAIELASMLRKESVQDLPAQILEIGCGTGIFTELLLDIFKNAEIDALDISGPMLECAREKLAKKARETGSEANQKIKFIEQDFRSFSTNFSTDLRYDLVLSSSSLQWLELESTFKKISQLLAPQGKFAASIVTDGTFREWQEIRDELLPHKRAKRILPTKEEILAALQPRSAIRICEEREFKVHYNSAAEFLQSIKELGITGAENSRENMLTRRELLEISRQYEARKGENGKVCATYKVLFLMA